jgi:type I restriction enzyme S subunit
MARTATKTGGRPATTGVIPGRYALSVGNPDREPPLGWRWTLVTDVARLETGHTPSRKHSEYWGGGIPWIGIRDATSAHGQTIHETHEYTNELGITNSSARVLPAETVCLSRTASVGYVVVMGRPMATSQDFVNWVCSDKIDYRFLKYVLLAEHDSLLMFASGSVHQTIYFPEVKAFYVCLPPIEEQRHIADVLSALDDKIDLNRRMNGTLEAIARATFKSWFVDFDPVRRKMEGGEVGLPPDLAALFPAEMDESSVGRIPKGWRCQPLGEVARFTRGRSYKGVELAPSDTALVTLKSFNRCGGYRADGLKDYTGPFKAEQVVDAGDVLIAHTDITQAAEVLGRAIRVRLSSRHRTLVASLDTSVVRPMGERIRREYLFFALDNEAFRDHAYGYCNGTTVLHLGAKALPEYRLVLPSQELAVTFSRIVGPMLSRADLLAAESAALASARDCLLPRLLGGGLGS